MGPRHPIRTTLLKNRKKFGTSWDFGGKGNKHLWDGYGWEPSGNLYPQILLVGGFNPSEE